MSATVIALYEVYMESWNMRYCIHIQQLHTFQQRLASGNVIDCILQTFIQIPKPQFVPTFNKMDPLNYLFFHFTQHFEYPDKILE